MAGVKKLRKIQLGRESTAGTEVDATTLWRGTGTIEDQLETVFPDEDIGYLSGVDRTYIPKVLAALEMDDTPATYEGILHVLEGGIKTATPTTTGGQYIYTYDFPTTAANTIKTYTIEAGDDAGEEQFKYGFVESFNLSGTAGEAVMMSANWLGRQVAPGSYTTGVSIPSVEEILFSKGILAIDATSAAWGTTPVTSTWLEFSLDFTTGWVPVFTGDGQIYFTFNKNIGPEVLLEVTMEHETQSIAQKAAWRAGTAKLIELKFTGTALGTTGTAYSTKTLKIQLAGAWESFDKLDELDGNDIVKGTFRARYDATGTKFGNIIDVCNLAAVP